MKKIAFCFLIYDDINLEYFWYLFFKNINSNLYNIYIHYKENKPLKYFDKFKINNCIETKYADISLVKAQNVLLENALKDPENKHFIFISGSCIPFKSFGHIYNTLNEKYSYFNLSPNTNIMERCHVVAKYIPQKYIRKSHQWCILNRKHAELMTNSTDYINWFSRGVYAPDEHCYITKLFNSHLINEIITTPNNSIYATTFTNWACSNYKYKFRSKSGLKTYNSISKEELKHILTGFCFFGRKFDKKCSNFLNNELYISNIMTK